MLKAFRRLGYNVEVAAGFSNERKNAINKIKREITLGRRYDFVYAENSTKPNALTETHHIPLRPTIDFLFFKFLKSYDIPIGLFYRDIYWKFDSFQKELGFFKANFSKFFFKFDLWQYKKYVDRIYVPSIKMTDYLPTISARKIDVLPPGHDRIIEKENKKENNGKLKLLYVGGVGAHYEMYLLCEMIQNLLGFELTICTRKSQWQQNRKNYASLLNRNITVVHNTNNNLEKLYNECDIAVLFVRPQVYRQFAVPFKLFEYIGHGKPILASAGTMAGQIVEENGIGWAVPYSKESIKNFFHHIQSNPEDIWKKEHKTKSIASKHTWLERAKKVANDFSRSAGSEKIPKYCRSSDG